MTEHCNIAASLSEAAREQPDAIAIRCPSGRSPSGGVAWDTVLSYRDLDARSDAIARGLLASGFARGERCALMVRPSPELFLLMFALFKAGIVPVLIDPGISKRALKQCLDEAAPSGFIGIPLAHVARLLLGWARASVKRTVTAGRFAPWGGTKLVDIEARGRDRSDVLCVTAPDDLAAILFTSGSTGVPKGVCYRHRHFVAQVAMLREAFGIEAGGVDLPTFPPFALFDPALGLTSIIPDMDPTRPARADPAKLVQAIQTFLVTQMFGSPALVDVLSRYGVERGIRLDSLKRVTSAGAPVPPDVVARMQRLLPEDGEIWTPYGATECLPVAVIEGRELRETRIATEAGAGTCIGRPVAGNTVRLIAITDAVIEDWSATLPVAPGTVGEITVAGPSATDSYHARPEATARAKILERLPDGSERIVHRMGDLGWFDDHGRLWFCGRKSQRVECADGPLFTEQVEPVFNQHAAVRRSALVGIGEYPRQRPVLVVELQAKADAADRRRIEAELRELGSHHAHTRRIDRFMFHPRFPVDIRHNAKIGREQLARWAAAQTGA
ncbi:olefin beta-lactone synthetase [Pseudomarimonas salicorniae]|uniref:Fatty acid CoA ligase family protein n=1 Tax=Pseudomarimonas salicorniae TaxID=2933270 RepID=A0ABT0GLV5_9GAMM|nr:fatty acid CoA ligase family protein [Lysobacter sp. CAU 1642]MCK7595524.1 fatty acid CoA ligase family protein [Lysobacter sp. CAU 1642]